MNLDTNDDIYAEYNITNNNQSTYKTKFITIPKKILWNMIEYYSKIMKDEKNLFNIKNWILFRERFSYSIPTKTSIDKMVKFIGADQVLEIGTRNGLHAYLLRLEGVKIIATDYHKRNQNIDTDINPYLNIIDIAPINAIDRYTDCNVLLVIWPPYKDPTAFNILERFEGDKFIYIGEDDKGSCADERFHKLLRKSWVLKEIIDIDRFYGTYDSVYLYTRR